ncbi:S1C family serine protease [Halobacillus sp. Marseille-Q1614]|uniref:S1C family serine protease n=1 Tax=Halobacillus sp. Marseille-Q1614 TaxID=2709134 RepID=UPI0015703286|nr:S1C family serine protease [Halobacillus sp. Marseille-Q1614]
MDIWLSEEGAAVLRFFTSPLLYWAILLLFIVSIRRMKQERRSFGTRVYDIFTEGRSTWKISILGGVLLSLLFVVSGMVLTQEFLWLLAAITILLSLPFNLKGLSPAYTVGISILLVSLLTFLPQSSLGGVELSPLTGLSSASLAILLSLMLVIEGILLVQTSSRRTFPERTLGKRGMTVGQHRVKKMAVIPVVTLFPSGMIEPFAQWWPVFDVAGSSFGLIGFPFLLGYEFVVKGQSPKLASINIGRQTILLAVISLLVATSGFFLPVLSLAAVGISIIGRFVIYMMQRSRDEEKAYFTEDHRGLRVLGTIPNSPADEMNLLPGELIVQVNGASVSTVREFYEALQRNRALTKMEVRDFRGENRFLQRAAYEGEHHELGVIFVQEVRYDSLAQ